jgi:cyclic dehypoxanthinyl futalosine synthase
MTSILSDVLAGNRLTAEQATLLFTSATLPDLGSAADEICTRIHAKPIRTYVIDRNINYTNVCVSGCEFCAFYKAPDSPDGYVLSESEALAKVEEAVDLGATQILMQGGLNPALKMDYYESLLTAIKSAFPTVQIHSFSAPEIAYIASICGLSTIETLSRLRAAGLDSLPGGGAEILVDSVRAQVSPGKCSAAEWLRIMEEAAESGLRATATMMFGHVESFADRVAHLEAIRDLQERTGVFTAFIPWTYQPGNTALGGSASGGHDYLRTLAISRLFLDNVENVQASWVTQGDRMAQVALRFGANDIGSTMIEENVVAAAGVRFMLSEQDLIGLIHAAGFDAAQRDTMYREIKRIPRSSL